MKLAFGSPIGYKTAVECQTISYHQAMDLAIEAAQKYLGATAPNPAVGACILNSKQEVLALAAHQRAGENHAEINDNN